jgi:glycosyltransferase involved in cell wall biosynthesis
MPGPVISLIVPTRRRALLLQSFLDSVAATADHPEAVEVVLVIDGDDTESLTISSNRLPIRHVIVSPGLTMGALNIAGCHASIGRYLMLLNDDVLVRTPGWDTSFVTCFQQFPDEILLIHVNDRLFETAQCTFPVVSRAYCQLIGGICPPVYARYRIDDHIEDIFNLLAVLGARRSVYLRDIIFEHKNYDVQANGNRKYRCDPELLTADAVRFQSLFAERKQAALRLMAAIHATHPTHAWEGTLDGITDSFALRVPGRLRVFRGTGIHLREDFAHWPWLLAKGRRLLKRWLGCRPATIPGKS